MAVPLVVVDGDVESGAHADLEAAGADPVADAAGGGDGLEILCPGTGRQTPPNS